MVTHLERRDCARFVEVLKYYLYLKYSRFIHESGHKAVLVEYGRDATPILTRTCFAEGSGGRMLVRNGFPARTS